MRVDDAGDARLEGLVAQVEKPRPGDLAGADAVRGLGHPPWAEIGGIGEDCSMERRQAADGIAGAQMREAIGKSRPGIDLGDQVGDLDQRHALETLPFHHFGGLGHGRALRRDDENAIHHANAGQLTGARPIGELLELEIHLAPLQC